MEHIRQELKQGLERLIETYTKQCQKYLEYQILRQLADQGYRDFHQLLHMMSEYHLYRSLKR